MRHPPHRPDRPRPPAAAPAHAVPDDVLAGDARHRRSVPDHVPAPGEVLELDGFTGEVTRSTPRELRLRDRRGRERRFGWDRVAWLADGTSVRLRAPAAATGRAPRVARSGAVRPDAPTAARVAAASRIWVEGVHDAELLEHVWGDELRELGVVVEPMHGMDDLAGLVAGFGPGPDRRLGVLLDHLVPGSKESRAAARVQHPDVLVTGHPHVDVWAAVRPERVGLDRWPDVPLGTPWKQGVCRALGVEEPAVLWRRVLASVRTWHDLDRPLVTAVELLIDHVAPPPDGP